MFSTSVGRVVRSTCTACSQTSLLTARSTSTCLAAAASKPLSQRTHQRRQSSSKASIPPDGSRRSAPSTQQTSGSSGRVGKRKTKEATTLPTDNRNQPFSKQYPNLPRVDSTQHLHQSGISIQLGNRRVCANCCRHQRLIFLLSPPTNLDHSPCSSNIQPLFVLSNI